MSARCNPRSKRCVRNATQVLAQWVSSSRVECTAPRGPLDSGVPISVITSGTSMLTVPGSKARARCSLVQQLTIPLHAQFNFSTKPRPSSRPSGLRLGLHEVELE